ncbi:tripartite tricarboxylate transporter substrate binding protein [Telmatospirillum sp. J64-1]|uniref:Bug family tripartite tricarboxylate transporter substrate binding protein n=1 Tax=Telmatospirillum sp. J64-1 TaxID=2502183 RepID=UPI00115EAA54|nr:tripartite tricarboxylate transporter substrate binding protein [Telmatospirillum sp. J64-1]
MKSIKRILGASAILATAAMPAFAADYPKRPVTLVVPYGTGGSTDIASRSLTNVLGKHSSHPIMVVNRVGAAGVTGSVSVANARDDGHTVLAARVGSHTINPAMKRTLPYTLDDFRFVGVFELNAVVCATGANSGIDTIEQLMDKIKADPGSVSYVSTGVGTLLQLASIMIMDAYGIENPLAVTHLPMRGGGEAATAVFAGNATFVCTNSSDLASFVANKQLKPLLTTTKERLPAFDAPTVAELGHPELEVLVGWTGIAGPANLPDEAAVQWGEWLKIATSDQGFVDHLTRMGSEVVYMDPDESKQFIQHQYEVFKELVTRLDLSVE